MDENQVQQQNIQGGDTPSQAQNSDTASAVPYTRFKEVNDRMRALEQELVTLREGQDKQRQTELAEQQRFKELAAELQAKLDAVTPTAQRAAELEESLKATVAKRVERLPEGVRTLVPEYADPRQTLAWLDTNEALLTRPVAPALDAGVAGDTGATKPVNLTDLELLIAKKAGMTPEQYAKRKAEGQQETVETSATSDVVRKLAELGHLSS